MTLEKFNEIKQAGIDKWEPALKLKTQGEKISWWNKVGVIKCSFCDYYKCCINDKDEICPLSDSKGKNTACMNEYELINNEWDNGDSFDNFESIFDANVPLILARIKALKPEDCGVIDE